MLCLCKWTAWLTCPPCLCKWTAWFTCPLCLCKWTVGLTCRLCLASEQFVLPVSSASASEQFGLPRLCLCKWKVWPTCLLCSARARTRRHASAHASRYLSDYQIFARGATSINYVVRTFRASVCPIWQLFPWKLFPICIYTCNCYWYYVLLSKYYMSTIWYDNNMSYI